jgi:hypothetical protein
VGSPLRNPRGADRVPQDSSPGGIPPRIAMTSLTAQPSRTCCGTGVSRGLP